MNYKFSDLLQAKDDFRRVFNTSLKPFLEDNLMMISLDVVLIDIIQFDTYLMKTHPEFRNTNISVSAVIQKYYGDNGTAVINKLML